MAEPQKRKLMFIKSPLHNLKAIESFLTKRNYEVIVETDVKESLIKVIEGECEFVFIALDHTNSQIMSVPKILSQSTQAYVIPYVQSSSKDAIRKLEFSGFAQKLYPPLSGPAIERLILKILKDVSGAVDTETRQKKSSTATSKEEMIKVKSNLLQSFEENNKSAPQSEATDANEVLVQKGKRSDLLKSKNQELANLKKNELDQEKKEKLKSDFNAKMRANLEDMIETYEDFSKSESAKKTTQSGLDNQSGSFTSGSGEKKSTNMLSTIQSGKALKPAFSVNEESSSSGKNKATTSGPNLTIAKPPPPPESEDNKSKNIMQSSEGLALDNANEESAEDHLDNYLAQKEAGTLDAGSVHDLLNDNNADTSADRGMEEVTEYDLVTTDHTQPLAIRNTAFCMTIQSATWCGYLLVWSDCEIDFSTSQGLFKEWLISHFENLTDLEDGEQFEIELTHAHFSDWAQEQADHYEVVKKHDNEIVLSFFSIDPRLLIVDMNENDLIEIALPQIPTDKELALSLYLHLPENKKYLLYTPAKQALSAPQRKRLTDKNVDKLYTPAEYEKEYRKLIAENHMAQLMETLKKETIA